MRRSRRAQSLTSRRRASAAQFRKRKWWRPPERLRPIIRAAVPERVISVQTGNRRGCRGRWGSRDVASPASVSSAVSPFEAEASDSPILFQQPPAPYVVPMRRYPPYDPPEYIDWKPDSRLTAE